MQGISRYVLLPHWMLGRYRTEVTGARGWLPVCTGEACDSMLSHGFFIAGDFNS